MDRDRCLVSYYWHITPIEKHVDRVAIRDARNRANRLRVCCFLKHDRIVCWNWERRVCNNSYLVGRRRYISVTTMDRTGRGKRASYVISGCFEISLESKYFSDPSLASTRLSLPIFSLCEYFDSLFTCFHVHAITRPLPQAVLLRTRWNFPRVLRAEATSIEESVWKRMLKKFRDQCTHPSFAPLPLVCPSVRLSVCLSVCSTCQRIVFV